MLVQVKFWSQVWLQYDFIVISAKLGFDLGWAWQYTKTLMNTFQATAHAAKLFKEVDVDGDGELNEEEFINGCKKDKVLMEKLQRIVDQCMGK